jgi:hypothetical protein
MYWERCNLCVMRITDGVCLCSGKSLDLNSGGTRFDIHRVTRHRSIAVTLSAQNFKMRCVARCSSVRELKAMSRPTNVFSYYAIQHYPVLLAYFPKKESEAYEITSPSVCPPVCVSPLITSEPIGRFLWNSVGRSCHWRRPRRRTF